MVILYSKEGCELCEELESRLLFNDIEYHKILDINISRSMGITRYPILESDGNFMDFMSAIIWLEENAD